MNVCIKHLRDDFFTLVTCHNQNPDLINFLNIFPNLTSDCPLNAHGQ